MNVEGLLASHPAVRMSIPEASKLECIHSGARHRVYRDRTNDGAVVVKMPVAELPAAHAVASLRHEYELLRALDAPGVVKVFALPQTSSGVALLMANAGESTLAELMRGGTLSIPDFLEIAAQLAETVAHLHRVRIVHRDIHPSNIVWDG